ncbi:DUF6332 family protein [Streptomyces sp. NRRL S-244]|uniref:DUF6332 family protein n=1 Tax=Streptomyces sp. NRRL S-244 TaxID=1463897 RepID=UPI0004C0DCE8|nr:DUF6332 family protein [Streptomyces sp. NRRL S-244]
MGRRTQADRDAITIEIGYAFVSGCFAAALVFGAVYGPALVFDVSPTADGVLTVTAGVLAGAVFLFRITHVLWRFARRTENDGR